MGETNIATGTSNAGVKEGRSTVSNRSPGQNLLDQIQGSNAEEHGRGSLAAQRTIELDAVDYPDQNEFALPLDNWSSVLRTESEKSMDDVFQDEHRCGKFLKELISLQDLKKNWDIMKNRIGFAEAQISEIQTTLN